LINLITTEKALRTADVGARHCRKSKHLCEAQQPPPLRTKRLVNLSVVPLEEAACLALNFAVVLVSVPIKDILCGVEKAIGALPEETG
jgi:hypothetical protein